MHTQHLTAKLTDFATVHSGMQPSFQKWVQGLHVHGVVLRGLGAYINMPSVMMAATCPTAKDSTSRGGARLTQQFISAGVDLSGHKQSCLPGGALYYILLTLFEIL